MAFALLIIGIVLLVSSVRGTQLCLIRVVQADFIGPANFTYWVVALIIVGALGYIDKLKKISDGLLVLIFVALFLSRGSSSGNFFGKFMAAIQGTNTARPIDGSNFNPSGPGVTVNIGGGGNPHNTGGGGGGVTLPPTLPGPGTYAPVYGPGGPVVTGPPSLVTD